MIKSHLWRFVSKRVCVCACMVRMGTGQQPKAPSSTCFPLTSHPHHPAGLKQHGACIAQRFAFNPSQIISQLSPSTRLHSSSKASNHTHTYTRTPRGSRIKLFNVRTSGRAPSGQLTWRFSVFIRTWRGTLMM